MTVRRRGGRKRALGTRAPMPLPQGANQRWSLDFVSDVLGRWPPLPGARCCRRLHPRVPGVGCRHVDLRPPGDARAHAIVAARSKPLTIVSDNGTELTSHAILRWQEERGVGWHYIAPGSRSRTPLSRASTGASATSASTSTCSVACRCHGGSLKPGGTIIMPAGRTPALAVWPQTSLPPDPNRTTTGTDSGYE